MNIPMSETQKSILIAAAEHPEHRVDWYPEGVKGGARARVLDSLKNKGLIEYQDDQTILSPAGFAALGLPAPAPESEAATEPTPSEPAAPEAPRARKTRENTKQAQVIAMLYRPEGATLEQLVEATGWQAHSVRGALSLLGKHLGLPIESRKTEAGRVYTVGAIRVDRG
jgi:DNA-binding MarR family transcriptional regulator